MGIGLADAGVAREASVAADRRETLPILFDKVRIEGQVSGLWNV
jgi:hypothetical protein